MILGGKHNHTISKFDSELGINLQCSIERPTDVNTTHRAIQHKGVYQRHRNAPFPYV